MQWHDDQKFLFVSLFLIANKLQIIGDRYLAPVDLTTKQWLLMVMILQFGQNPPTISQAAGIIGSSRQNVKQLALKLEKNGYIKIEKDSGDSRILRLRLTNKHMKLWEERSSMDEDFLANLFSEIDSSDLHETASAMDKILEKTEMLMRDYNLEI